MQMGAVVAFTLKKTYVNNSLYSLPTFEILYCLGASILHLIRTVQGLPKYKVYFDGLFWKL